MMKTEKQKEADRIWYLKNRERILLMRKEYHKKNAETIRARVRKWKVDNKERVKEWNSTPEQLLKTQVRKRNYYLKNKQQILEQTKFWKAKNPEKVRYSHCASKANSKTIAGGMLRWQTVQAVYEDNIKRYGTLTCIVCLNSIKLGEDSLEHKIPISRGGTNSYENLGISHMKCNLLKRDRTMEELQEA